MTGWRGRTSLALQNEAAGRPTSGARIAVLAFAAALALAAALPRPVEAAVFHCASGDTACLIASINAANANGSVSTIILEAGTYTLGAVDNTTEGPNGLPVIRSPLTIMGAAQSSTVIEPTSTLAMRLVYVGQAGVLTLEALTLKGGTIPPPNEGGGVLNRGSLALNQVTVANNVGGGIGNFGTIVVARSTVSANSAAQAGYPFFYGGIHNAGTATVLNSTIVGNTTRSQAGSAGGGVLSSGSLWIFNSTIAQNQADIGAGLNISGTAAIVNSTIANNSTYDMGEAGGIYSTGTVAVTNTTIALNSSSAGGGGVNTAGGTMTIASSTIALNTLTGEALGAGIASSGGVFVQDTIVAGNTGQASFAPFSGKDCNGPVTSLDNNFIGNPAGCTITLLPFDQTGNPGLGTFTDDGTPGHGYVPLLANSPAIDAGNAAACLPTDQLGQARVGTCDIGAVEFQGQAATLTAAITSPANGSSVSNSVTVRMAVSNAQAPTRFVLALDNATTLYDQSVTGTTASTTWSTTGTANGTHTLTLTATDATGKAATASVTVTVSNTTGGGGGGTSPTVTITSPASGAWTGGSINVSASATDNVALTSIKFYGNGGVFGTLTCGGATCSGTVTWITGSLAPAAYQVQAVATNTAGNATTSPPVTINKDATSPTVASGASAGGGGGATTGGGGDTTPPTVAITKPSSGAWTGNSIDIIAAGSDNVGLTSIAIYGDGALVQTVGCGGTATCNTGTVWWSTGSLGAGQHTITAVATDTSGNSATSAPVTINK